MRKSDIKILIVFDSDVFFWLWTIELMDCYRWILIVISFYQLAGLLISTIQKFLWALNLRCFFFLVHRFFFSVLTSRCPQNRSDDVQFRFVLRGRWSCQTRYNSASRDVSKILRWTSKHFSNKTFRNEIGNRLFVVQGDSIFKENFGCSIKRIILYFSKYPK